MKYRRWSTALGFDGLNRFVQHEGDPPIPVIEDYAERSQDARTDVARSIEVGEPARVCGREFDLISERRSLSA